MGQKIGTVRLSLDGKALIMPAAPEFEGKAYPDLPEQQAQVMASGKWFEKVMRHVCMPFLSAEELERIFRGEDIWLDTDDIRRRLHRIQQGLPTTVPRKPRAKKSE